MSVLYAGARADEWREIITEALGPIDPHGVPDRLLVGVAGAVLVGELEQRSAGGATRTPQEGLISASRTAA
jgi:hypothetical protein